MSIEYTIAQFELSLARISVSPATVAGQSAPWWPLTQIVLGALLFLYVVGWIQDFERVRDLRAEPSPFQKVIITKNQAWDRIRIRQGRSPHPLASALASWRHKEAESSTSASTLTTHAWQ
jgi:hypothetical protein